MRHTGSGTVALIVLFIVGMVSGLVIGYVVASQNSQAQIVSLQADKSGLQTRVATLEDENGDLMNRVSELERQRPITVSSEIISIDFSPEGGCANRVIYWIGRANQSIHVLIYSFTLDSIGDALIEAHERGILIGVVFEKSQISQYSEYSRLEAAGVFVREDTNPQSMHHKLAIIDGSIILVGSFNWSANAEEENNEDLLVIKSTAWAEILEREFQEIWITGR